MLPLAALLYINLLQTLLLLNDLTFNEHNRSMQTCVWQPAENCLQRGLAQITLFEFVFWLAHWFYSRLIWLDWDNSFFVLVLRISAGVCPVKWSKTDQQLTQKLTLMKPSQKHDCSVHFRLASNWLSYDCSLFHIRPFSWMTLVFILSLVAWMNKFIRTARYLPFLLWVRVYLAARPVQGDPCKRKKWF